MRNIIVVVVFLLFTISKTQAESASDKGHACIIQDLQRKGLLEEDFPSPANTVGCHLAASVMSSLEDAFYGTLDDKESIKADCVKPKLKQYNLFDYAMKKEIVEMSRQIPKEKADEFLKSAKNGMKEALDKSAKDCDSDPTWAGIYDEILGIKNTTLVVLQKNYCMLKNSIDKNLLKVGEIEMNPENIDIDNLDCDELIQNHVDKLTNEMRKKYEEKGMRGAQVDCVIDTFKTGNAFDIIIALEVIEKLDISPGLRRENKEELTPGLEKIIRNLFSCFF